MIKSAFDTMSYIGGLAGFGSIVIVFLMLAKKMGEQDDE